MPPSLVLYNPVTQQQQLRSEDHVIDGTRSVSVVRFKGFSGDSEVSARGFVANKTYPHTTAAVKLA